MTSEQSVPDELSIDSDGKIRLTKNLKKEYNFDIIIGNDVDETPITNIQISIACCSNSVTIECIDCLSASEPEQITQAKNHDPHLMLATVTIRSSRDECPVQYAKLDDESKTSFTLEVIEGGVGRKIEIKLRPENATTEGIYDYIIMSKAEGGAERTIEGNMIVGPDSYDCDDAIAYVVPSDLEYDIPMSAENLTETIVDFRPNYSECFSNIEV